MNRARSNLAQPRGGIDIPGVYLEDLCFQAQQAAEKALKAVLIWLHAPIPRTHDLAELLTRLEEAGHPLPDALRRAAALTPYAVATRYPGTDEPVPEQEWLDALVIAAAVVRWAENLVGYGR